MNNTDFTTLHDLLRGFTRAMNLINSEVQGHHEKVAYIAYCLSDHLGLSEQERCLAMYSAIMHDIGGILMPKNLSLRELEMNPKQLVEAGSSFLKLFPATQNIASVVSECQSPWRVLKGLHGKAQLPRRIGQIVHLSDVVSLLLQENQPILNQVASIKACASLDTSPAAKVAALSP